MHAEPMKNRTKESILHAHQRAHAIFVKAGLRPQLQRLDNECSDILKECMHDENADFQLVPLYSHRCNAAERAIRTFKNHFIAGLATTNTSFPLHLWDKLLPQALLTLNLLCGSRINPKLSAYAQVYGHFDFNRTPIAPPGIKVLAHKNPSVRTSWGAHAEDGWYVGPALDSYRCCIICMVKRTSSQNRLSRSQNRLSPAGGILHFQNATSKNKIFIIPNSFIFYMSIYTKTNIIDTARKGIRH